MTAAPPAFPVAPRYPSALAMIGNTPLVEVRRLDTGPCRLFLKLENQNPGGAIKDRVGRPMIEAAEADGRLKPGGPNIEATAGNTGLGLALVAAQKGYRLVIVVPDKMAQEKLFHLRALGAEIYLTRSDVGKGHPAYYQDMAERLARENGWFYVNQFGNPANPRAHLETTGPELWAQMQGRVDAVVCGVGSGGTITGLSRFFAGVSPATEMVLADPKGSILAHYVATHEVSTDVGSWTVEGIGEDFIPEIADLSRTRLAYTIDDKEALNTARELLRLEGILGGSSTGTLLAAALRYCREQTTEKHVVTFVCDSGNKYLSKQFNDFWMLEQGFIERPRRGDLGDLVSRRHEDRATVTLQAEDTLLIAQARMRLYDISQLPVLDAAGTVVGILAEEDLLFRVMEAPARFKDPVASAMSTRLDTIQARQPLADLKPIFAKGHVAIVLDGDQFLGLITRMDLLTHLRRKATT